MFWVSACLIETVNLPLEMTVTVRVRSVKVLGVRRILELAVATALVISTERELAGKVAVPEEFAPILRLSV